MSTDNSNEHAPRRTSYTLQPETGRYSLRGQPVALILNGPSRIEVNDFKGRADGHVKEDGTLNVSIQGGPRRGRLNEYSVLKVLSSAIATQSSLEVTVLGGDDSRGEDGRLQIASDNYVVQIVTVPVDQEYGQKIASGDFQIRLTADIAANWINAAIQHKLTIVEADRARTILALDIRHVAILTDERVLQEFASRFPATGSLGFAQIWLVGPLRVRSARIA